MKAHPTGADDRDTDAVARPWCDIERNGLILAQESRVVAADRRSGRTPPLLDAQGSLANLAARAPCPEQR
jgi:hypothetical protein